MYSLLSLPQPAIRDDACVSKTFFPLDAREMILFSSRSRFAISVCNFSVYGISFLFLLSFFFFCSLRSCDEFYTVIFGRPPVRETVHFTTALRSTHLFGTWGEKIVNLPHKVLLYLRETLDARHGEERGRRTERDQFCPFDGGTGSSSGSSPERRYTPIISCRTLLLSDNRYSYRQLSNAYRYYYHYYY